MRWEFGSLGRATSWSEPVLPENRVGYVLCIEFV